MSSPHRRTKQMILLTISALVLILAAIVGRELYWAATARPTPTINYRERLESLMADTQRPGRDASPALNKAISIEEQWAKAINDRALADPNATFEDFDFNQITFGTYPRPGLEAPLASLAEIERLGIADALDEVASADRFHCELRIDPNNPESDPTSLLNLDPAHHSRLRQLLWTRLATMRIAAHNADWPAHLRATRHALALCVAIDSRSLLMDRLLAIPHVQATLREIRWGALDGTYPESHCNALINEINRRLPLRPFQIILDAERLYVEDQLQRMYEGPPGADTRIVITAASQIFGFNLSKHPPSISDWTPTPPTVHWTANLHWRRFPRRLAAERSYNDLFAVAAQRTILPHPRGESAPVPSADWLTKLTEVGMNVSSSFQITADADDACRADIAGTLLLLAIERHRALHAGAPPAALDALVPDILPTLPADPYAPDHRFRYLLLTPADIKPDTPPYLLYSVGPDAVDNNANDTADPFTLPFVGARNGSDVVINQPRAPERAESEP